jgi:transcriptional regulator with XRE-family HTH domain
MDDFGGKLRQARERRGISLRQIAASTKISIAALEALERNDASRLPGGIFSRAFVRSYAVEAGLDPDQTVREFLEWFERRARPALSERSHARVEASSVARGASAPSSRALPEEQWARRDRRYERTSVRPAEAGTTHGRESRPRRIVSADEGEFESRQRMASVLLKIIVASAVTGAIILYFTWRPTH